jgi:hypothetical protein
MSRLTVPCAPWRETWSAPARAITIAAPTVTLVRGSITMKLPVCRLRWYSSTNSGLKKLKRARPMSFRPRRPLPRRSVGSTRY